MKAGSYFRFINASVKANGFSRREAAAHFRAMKEALGKSPARSDLKNHPVIARKAAKATLAKRLPARPGKPGKPKGKRPGKRGKPGGGGASPIPPSVLPPPTEPEEYGDEDYEYEAHEEEGDYE